jgi:octaprenyl-diphosphate synthase
MLHKQASCEQNPYTQMNDLVLSDLVRVDAVIKRVAQSHVEMVPEVVNHLVELGGKRIRPMLTILCGKMLHSDIEVITKLAAAVEFIHTATLFHDDVIDESTMRRGRSTANSIWGNKASILVGDFLLSHAFKLMVESGSLKALDMLSSAAIAITESEVWQLELIGNLLGSKEQYIKLVEGKTAILFAASCAVGAVLELREDGVMQALYDYGMNLGIIFQITDDMLDYYATEPKFGKQIGGDFLERKATLPLLMLYEVATQQERHWISEQFNSIAPNVVAVVAMMRRYKIREMVEQYMDSYITAALACLDGITVQEEGLRVLLKDFVYFVSKREA